MKNTKSILRRLNLGGKTPGGWYLALRRLIKRILRRSRPLRWLNLDGQEFAAIDYMGFEVIHTSNSSIVKEIEYTGENFEPEFLRILIHEIRRRKPELVLDIGANIGLISVALLRNFKNLRIVAFEPGPVQAQCLAHTISRNNLATRLILHRTAVGKEHGNLEFFIHSAEHASGDGFRDTGRAGEASRIQVPCITLDGWWNSVQRPKVGVIKIDVEGAEHWVLQGGLGLIDICKPTVFYEVCIANTKCYSHAPTDTIRLLEQHGYAVYDVQGLCISGRGHAGVSFPSGMYTALPLEKAD